MATENLGEGAGLLAAAALMIDYILTAAVGISAGVTAVTSVESKLIPYTLPMCLILAILALVNLRGVKDTGAAFILPTFMFIGTLMILVGVGVFKTDCCTWSSRAGGADAATFRCRRPLRALCFCVADHEGVLERMRRDDRRGSGIERCDGFR